MNGRSINFAFNCDVKLVKAGKAAKPSGWVCVAQMQAGRGKKLLSFLESRLYVVIYYTFLIENKLDDCFL